jgi:hypothetical protein
MGAVEEVVEDACAVGDVDGLEGRFGYERRHSVAALSGMRYRSKSDSMTETCASMDGFTAWR